MSEAIWLKMRRKQILAVIAVLLGIGVILTLSIGLRSRPDVKSAVAANCISQDSVSKFQWARTVEELNGAFGPVESQCRPLTIAALDAANSVDVYLLIPLYALFYSAAALALGQWRNPFTKAAIAVAVIGGLADYLETLSELRISTTAPVDQLHLLGFANIGTWTKFLCLAVLAACIAILARSSSSLQKWLLAAGFLLLPATLITFVDPNRLGFVMSTANILFAIALLVSLVIQIFRLRPPNDSTARAKSHPAI